MTFCSIVIPTFNRAPLLARTLGTVQRQTLRDFECIVVDDGGTDDTERVVRALDDGRFRYLWKENAERGAARNQGVRLAQGEYVYFLDSDDRLTPDHLEHGRACLERLSWPGVLHSRFAWADAEGRVTELQRYPRSLRSALGRRNYVGCYLFERRDVALRFPFLEDRRLNLGEDWFQILLVRREHDIHLTDRVTRHVLRHPGQSMHAPSARFAQCRELLVAALRERAAMSERELHPVEAEMRSLTALALAVEGDGAGALAEQARAIALSPGLALERRTAAVLKHAVLGAVRAR